LAAIPFVYQAVRFSADIIMGIPSIVIGVFVYAVVVQPAGGFSTLAGAAALAIIMVRW
jgi:phosphate transport system permease protein